MNSYLRLCWDDRLRRAREEAGTLEQAYSKRLVELSQSADHRETIYFTLEEIAVKSLRAGTRKLLIACVLSARILPRLNLTLLYSIFSLLTLALNALHSPIP